MTRTKSRQQRARWNYHAISLELTACLIKGRKSFPVPAYVGEGWAHSYLKIIVAAHLLHWGYGWSSILWEYDPLEIVGRHRADVYVRGRGTLPSFWFECRTVSIDKLRHLRSHLPSEIRLIQVLSHDWFLRWWNGENLARQALGDPALKRQAVRKHRGETSVVGVEYWAIYDTSTSARILFAVRADGNDRYTYFDTGEGWSLN
jgi:hypothetical protein